MKRIDESEKTCAKVVDQVSQTLEALMDDEQSQRIASDLTAFEANIMQIWNRMKKIPLEQKKVKAAKMWKLQQKMAVLRTQ